MNIKKFAFYISLIAVMSAVFLCSCTDKETLGNNDENNKIVEPVQRVDVAFSNNGFKSAISNALSSPDGKVTQEDIDSIYYLGLFLDQSGKYILTLGQENYRNAYFAELEKQSPDVYAVAEYVKKSEFAYDFMPLEKDLKKFKNIEIFEIYNVQIFDVSFINEYKNLTYGYFLNNKITDISKLEGYNPEKLCELDFSENAITDWSYLTHLQDKIIVSTKRVQLDDKNGQKQFKFESVTLREYNEQQEQVKENLENTKVDASVLFE